MDLLEAHGLALDVFDRATHKVGLTDWDSATPCTDWTVRDLVNHIMLAGRTVAVVGDKFDGDQLRDDPLGAWSEASQVARAAWLQPGAVEQTVHLSFGDSSAEEYGWQMTTDLAVHGWDLATALGADAGIPDELASRLVAYVEPQVSTWAGTSMFAKPVPVPDDASSPARLVALLGRQP
jgi:uncharacterized protein (TIGR03086 family)